MQSLGSYQLEIEAARAYDQNMISKGEDASKLNFPDGHYPSRSLSAANGGAAAAAAAAALSKPDGPVKVTSRFKVGGSQRRCD